MISKEIHATYDGQSFHVNDPIDIAPNTECIIYVEEVHDQKPIHAIDYLFSISGTVHGPSDLSIEHDHYLYGTNRMDA